MLLHVTNGDSAATLLRAGGCQGRILPWRDVLHEGPVPALDLAELSRVRAAFLAGRDWGKLTELQASFESRDRVLNGCAEFAEVVLWFEHDLYDQLQLAQILSVLARHPRCRTRVSLICIDRHPSVARFRGLGDLLAEHIAPLHEARTAVDTSMFASASRVWQAFTGSNPAVVQSAGSLSAAALPFMPAAIQRFLQELPSTFNGLGRSQHHALSAIACGCSDPVALLRAHWEQEEAPFMGDWSFWHLLRVMAKPPIPLVAVANQRGWHDLKGATLALTDAGGEVLAGRQDAVCLRGMDRWYGGTRLAGRHVPWRWDTAQENVVSC